jgi:hypothetical protein
MPAFPALATSGFWLLRQLRPIDAPLDGRVAWPIMLGALAAVAGAVNLVAALPHMETFRRAWTPLERAGMEAHGFGIVPPALPADAALFADDATCAHLQFAGDSSWRLFNLDLFNPHFFDRWMKRAPNDPQMAQPRRVRYLHDRFGHLSESDLDRALGNSVTALVSGRVRTFFIVPRISVPSLRQRLGPEFDLKPVATWNDPTAVIPDPVPPEPTAMMRRKHAPLPVFDPQQTASQILEVTRRTTVTTSTPPGRS